MTTVIISDIHNRVNWIEPALKKLKEKLNYDEVVFLGDYFDMFHDAPFDVGGTAVWLRQSLENKDRIHLLGNHDMPYMCPQNGSQYCPGYSDMKGRAVRTYMKDWSGMKPAYFTQGYLLSHAGFNARLVTHPINGIPDGPGLVKLAEEQLEQVKAGQPAPLFLPGSRMAEKRKGGITWCDWDDEFEHLPNFSQIVGHTPDRGKVRKLFYDDGSDYCMDTHNQHIGVITDGVVEFHLRSQLIGF